MRIKKPNWHNPNGCVARECIDTPEGWLGYRKDFGGYVVTGIFDNEWKDYATYNKVETAKQIIENIYYERVKKWVEYDY